MLSQERLFVELHELLRLWCVVNIFFEVTWREPIISSSHYYICYLWQNFKLSNTRSLTCHCPVGLKASQQLGLSEQFYSCQDCTHGHQGKLTEHMAPSLPNGILLHYSSLQHGAETPPHWMLLHHSSQHQHQKETRTRGRTTETTQTPPKVVGCQIKV